MAAQSSILAPPPQKKGGLKEIWASLVAQRLKSLPPMQKTQVRSLGREDLLEKEMATQSSILAWKNPMDREAWWSTVHGVTKSQT